MNPHLQTLLESRDLLEHSASDPEVAGVWGKAVQTLENSRRGLDPPVEFIVAYTAAFQAASALLAACGYRPGGRDHHHNAFAGVLALSEGALASAARTLDRLRLRRHQTVYGYQLDVPKADFEALRDAVAVMMKEGYRLIGEARPSLASLLHSPPAE